MPKREEDTTNVILRFDGSDDNYFSKQLGAEAMLAPGLNSGGESIINEVEFCEPITDDMVEHVAYMLPARGD